MSDKIPNRHQPYELAQMQSLSLASKVTMTQRRIRDWYEYWDGNVYVSISGGKDSQVLAYLVKQYYPDVPCVFINTGLEFDSVRKKAITLADDVLKPDMDFVSVITKYGYPIISKEVSECVDQARKGLAKNGTHYSYRIKQLQGTALDKNGNKSVYNQDKYAYLLDAPFRISNRCCNIMKKHPAKTYAKTNNRKPFIGTLAEESRLRKQQWIKNGCNGFDMKSPVSNPLSFWTEQDILQFIYDNKLDIAEIYGNVIYESDIVYKNALFNPAAGSGKLITTGAKRTGCVFCLFGITQDSKRLLVLKQEEPKKYDYVMRGGCFDDSGMWIPGKDADGVMGLGYKFIIDWLNEYGNLNIEY